MDTNDWSINTLKLTIIWMEIPSVIPLVYKGLVPDSVVKLLASLTADPGVVSSIPARRHTFVEPDHEIFSTDILLHLLIQEGLQKYVHGVLVNCLV